MLEILSHLTDLAGLGGEDAKRPLALWDELTAADAGAAAADDDLIPAFSWLARRFKTEISHDPPRCVRNPIY